MTAKKRTAATPSTETPDFDFESLTLGEVSTIEDLSGMSIGSIADEGAPKGKAFAAIVMIMKRRNGDPGFTFNQALGVPLSEANALLGGDDADPEADAKGEGSRSDGSANA